MAMTWQWHGNDMAMAWQWHGNDMAMTRQWHGNDMAMTWQWHGNDMAMTWQWHGNATAMTWQWHGNAMAMTWQWHGNDMAMSFGSIHCMFLHLVVVLDVIYHCMFLHLVVVVLVSIVISICALRPPIRRLVCQVVYYDVNGFLYVKCLWIGWGEKKAINRILFYILWLLRPDEKTAIPRNVIRIVIIRWCSLWG